MLDLVADYQEREKERIYWDLSVSPHQDLGAVVGRFQAMIESDKREKKITDKVDEIIARKKAREEGEHITQEN